MTNYNERLDEILAELLWCDKSKAHLVQHYTHRRTNHRAGANAKQALISLTKELAPQAKPEKQNGEMVYSTWGDGYDSGIDEFEQNLLKALEEV